MTIALVTGSRGFLGRNLVTALGRLDDLEVREYTSQTPPEALPEMVKDADIIFHLAGVNRPDDEADFVRGNVDVTKHLVASIVETESSARVVYASSQQAELDNPYGRSKLAAEQHLKAAHAERGIPLDVYRLPGVFGKWSRPFYNTVVATFCHQIARGEKIHVRDPEHTLDLVYVDDVVRAFTSHLVDTQSNGTVMRNVARRFHVSLGELADRIRRIHSVRHSLRLPDLSDEFNQCLYATYLSFLPDDDLAHSVELRTDDRGWLFELLKSDSFGQIFVSTTAPGVTRGNHYHDSKVEKFCLIQGKGMIRFREPNSSSVLEYEVNDQDIRVVDIPPGVTHSIENIGDSTMVVLFWSNQIFDPEVPDTYWEPVIQ